MSTKRLALFSSDIADSSRAEFIRGLWSSCELFDYDIVVFTSFVGGCVVPASEAVELSVYKLFNPELFDAVIVQLDGVSNREIKNDILDMIRKCDLPTICCDNSMPDATYCIGIDHYMSCYELTNHLIEVHDCRNIGFLRMHFDSRVSEEYYDAYKDCLGDHGIFFDESLVFDFDGTSSAEDIFSYYRNPSTRKIDALIAGNDYIAINVGCLYMKNGISIPEDLKLAGIGNSPEGRTFIPRITTFGFSTSDLGRQIIILLMDHFSGEKHPHNIKVKSRLIFSGSCGCPSDNPLSDHDIISAKLSEYQDQIYDYEESQKSRIRLMSIVNNIETSMSIIEEEIRSFKPAEAFLCTCRHSLEPKTTAELLSSDTGMIDIPSNFTDVVDIPFIYSVNARRESMTGFSREQLLPGFDRVAQGGHIYVVSTLHREHSCLGYFVSKDCRRVFTYTYYDTLLYLAAALENMMITEALGNMTVRFRNISFTDTLTGTFNRLGFISEATELLQTCRRQGRTVVVGFIDLDNLKTINDSFGHEMGDLGIKLLSTMLRKHFTESTVFGRLGGDEFAVMIPDVSERSVIERSERLTQSLSDYCKEQNLPFEIAYSFGIYGCVPDSGDTVEGLLDVADKRMYAAKERKKKERRERFGSMMLLDYGDTPLA